MEKLKINPKQTARDKAEARRRNAVRKLLESPIIAMCNWEQYNPALVDTRGKLHIRLPVIRMTKRSVTMRSIEGNGIITLSSTPGWNVFDFVKIEPMPCDTTPSIKMDEKMKAWVNQDRKPKTDGCPDRGVCNCQDCKDTYTCPESLK